VHVVGAPPNVYTACVPPPPPEPGITNTSKLQKLPSKTMVKVFTPAANGLPEATKRIGFMPKTPVLPKAVKEYPFTVSDFIRYVPILVISICTST
jgi:hypothetical protein